MLVKTVFSHDTLNFGRFRYQQVISISCAAPVVLQKNTNYMYIEKE